MTIPEGTIIEDRTLPPDGHWGRVLRRGQTLRIIDLEGKQAVDFLCYNAEDPSERYNAADTMKYAGTIFLTEGHGIYSDMGRRLFTIVEDTCGRHDTIGGCCSAESNELRYGAKDTPGCRQNFLRALAPFGLGKKDITANLNWFMNVPVGPDGAMGIADGLSKPGDHVELRAEMDVHLGAELDVVAGLREAVGDAHGAVGAHRHVHEPVQVGRDVLLAEAEGRQRAQEVLPAAGGVLGAVAKLVALGAAAAADGVVAAAGVLDDGEQTPPHVRVDPVPLGEEDRPRVLH